VLTFESARAIDVAPGQFAMVRSETWGAAPLLPRPMSLLTGGHRPSILIKVVGEGTRRMAVASSGEPFHLLAPLGKPWSKVPDGVRPVLVAGGVGVAPLLYLARALSIATVPQVVPVPGAPSALSVSPAPKGGAPAAQGERPLALYGGRTSADLPFEREMAAVSEMRVSTEDGSRGTKGRVTALLAAALDELGAQGQAVKVYTCGPHGMMAAVAAMCAERGVACEVSLETPMGCGYGVCLGCPVPRTEGGYLYACTEGPCVDAAAIDWGGPSGAPKAGGQGT
jgi:dihydroorotate dehydrogenase electron transfer subunit